MTLSLEARRATQSAVEVRLDLVRRRLRAHAGGIELHGVSSDGIVQLRFTGMCAGCLLKPLTMASVVIPALRSLEAVREVVAPGARIATVSQARLRTINSDGAISSRSSGLRRSDMTSSGKPKRPK